MSPSCCNAWICSTSSPKSSKSNPPSTNLNQILSSSFSPQLFEVLKMEVLSPAVHHKGQWISFIVKGLNLLYIYDILINQIEDCNVEETISSLRETISENSYHVTSLIAIECRSCSACHFDKKLMFSVSVIVNEWHCKNVYCEFFQCICLYLYLLTFWVLKQ